jgi:NADH-quinone oxidoreductase subunit A
MVENYLPILIFIALGVVFGLVPIAIGAFVSPRRPDPEKLSAYECGFPAFEDARLPFDVRFYLVAILFIIFDLETAFLFPWAVTLRHIGWFGLFSMMLFLGILVIGFIFEWKKGALEWE